MGPPVRLLAALALWGPTLHNKWFRSWCPLHVGESAIRGVRGAWTVDRGIIGGCKAKYRWGKARLSTVDIKTWWFILNMLPKSMSPKKATPVDDSQVVPSICYRGCGHGSEFKCNNSGGDPGFYYSKMARGLRMKQDQSEVFLGMGDEDATLSCEGGSNDTECIIEIQSCRS